MFMSKIKKINKHDYYLNIAKAIALKSNCLCIAYGCLIVKNDAIISAGYVGAPRKTMDCIELGFCIRRKNNIPSGTGYEMCRSVHAEMNAIINAARAGVSLLDGDMYLYTMKRVGDKDFEMVDAYPCLLCKKMIINAGIKTFVGNTSSGKHKIYTVKNWVKDWKDNEDIREGKEKYSVTYKK